MKKVHVVKIEERFLHYVRPPVRRSERDGKNGRTPVGMTVLVVTRQVRSFALLRTVQDDSAIQILVRTFQILVRNNHLSSRRAARRREISSAVL